jgi:hypothetical protein
VGFEAFILPSYLNNHCDGQARKPRKNNPENPVDPVKKIKIK